MNNRDIAGVLLVMQGAMWLGAGILATFVGALEPAMGVLGVLTIAMAVTVFSLARRVRRGRRWARRVVIGIEAVFLIGSVLLALLPVGSVRGPVPLLTNFALPLAVVLLVRNEKVGPGGVEAAAGS